MLSLIYVVIGLAERDAQAGFNQITVDPPGGSIVVGYVATYTAEVTVDPFPVASYVWKYKCNEIGCAGD